MNIGDRSRVIESQHLCSVRCSLSETSMPRMGIITPTVAFDVTIFNINQLILQVCPLASEISK